MAMTTKTVELTASPDQVWEVLSNPSRFDEWLGMHKKWKAPAPTTLVEGTKLPEAVVSLLNMANTFTWTVTKVDNAGRSATLFATGMAGVKVTLDISVETVDAGSLVDITAQFEGALIKGALAKAAESAFAADIEESFVRLKPLVAAS